MDIKLILDLHDRFMMGKMAEIEHKISFLEKDQRQDEANLYKARRNVFDVFRKMLAASRKKEDKALESYRNYLIMIPKNWMEAREQAISYGDINRQTVEDMKLSAHKEIVQHLSDTTGEGGQEQ